MIADRMNSARSYTCTKGFRNRCIHLFCFDVQIWPDKLAEAVRVCTETPPLIRFLTPAVRSSHVNLPATNHGANPVQRSPIDLSNRNPETVLDADISLAIEETSDVRAINLVHVCTSFESAISSSTIGSGRES